ncbi:hypothetical protein H4W32_000468 [Actinophytocola algeriensis]|nr:hypothetical protein [Actinophytocola algeriensis]
MSSGSPAATREPNVLTSTTSAISNPTTSVPRPLSAELSPYPPSSTRSPASRAGRTTSASASCDWTRSSR